MLTSVARAVALITDCGFNFQLPPIKGLLPPLIIEMKREFLRILEEDLNANVDIHKTRKVNMATV